MPVHSLIHAIGSTGVFPSRAFLPSFVAAFLLRFGDSLPLVAHAGIATSDAPALNLIIDVIISDDDDLLSDDDEPEV